MVVQMADGPVFEWLRLFWTPSSFCLFVEQTWSRNKNPDRKYANRHDHNFQNSNYSGIFGLENINISNADLKQGPHQLIPSSLELLLDDHLIDPVNEACKVDELVQQEEDHDRGGVPPQQLRGRRIYRNKKNGSDQFLSTAVV